MTGPNFSSCSFSFVILNRFECWFCNVGSPLEALNFQPSPEGGMKRVILYPKNILKSLNGINFLTSILDFEVFFTGVFMKL